MIQSTFGDFEGVETEVVELCVCGGSLAKCLGVKETLKCVVCDRKWIVAGSEEWRSS